MRCHLSTFLHPEALGRALGPTKLFFRAVSPLCESSKDVRDRWVSVPAVRVEARLENHCTGHQPAFTADFWVTPCLHCRGRRDSPALTLSEANGGTSDAWCRSVLKLTCPRLDSGFELEVGPIGSITC